MLYDNLRIWLVKADHLIKTDFDYFCFILFSNEEEIMDFLDNSTSLLNKNIETDNYTTIFGENFSTGSKLIPLLKNDTELKIKTIQEIKKIILAKNNEEKEKFIKEYEKEFKKKICIYSIISLSLDLIFYGSTTFLLALFSSSLIHLINSTTFNIFLILIFFLAVIYTTISNINIIIKKESINIDFIYAVFFVAYGLVEYFQLYNLNVFYFIIALSGIAITTFLTNKRMKLKLKFNFIKTLNIKF
ncbi:hypothetical protein OFK41_08210 [Acinetobacter baumannii]|uniref:hypothetical protein n=1 Tax=Acinetobacter baumannii TaxID=470 RepID=UPI00224E1D0F|nr:hypothetical protein [Acinetobacter baumannii]MCX3034189.1 hypothetical protein [Acinetobacter baumannii]